MAENTNTETETERAILNLNGREFYKDSITEDGNAMIQNIGVIDQQLADAQLGVDIIKIAKDSLIKELDSMSSNFEEKEKEETK